MRLNNEYNDYDNDMLYGDICTFTWANTTWQASLDSIMYLPHKTIYHFKVLTREIPPYNCEITHISNNMFEEYNLINYSSRARKNEQSHN